MLRFLFILFLNLLVRLLEPDFPPSENRRLPPFFPSLFPLLLDKNQLEIFSESLPGRGKFGSSGDGPISSMFCDRLLSVHSLMVFILLRFCLPAVLLFRSVEMEGISTVVLSSSPDKDGAGLSAENRKVSSV